MEGTQSDPNVILEKQAAKRLGVARITLLRAREAGRIRFFRIGTRVLYSEEHISEFLQLCESSGRQSVDRKPAVISDGLKPNGGTLEGKLEGMKKASGLGTTHLLPFS